MLASQAGECTTVARNWADPAAPPLEEKGSATRTMILDGRVMVETYRGTMMGAPFTGQAKTGYDNVSGKYWATWIDSMSTGIMMMEGNCDADMACTFTGTYNDAYQVKVGATLNFRDRWEAFAEYGWREADIEADASLIPASLDIENEQGLLSVGMRYKFGK